MGFFQDSKPPKTELQYYSEWLKLHSFFLGHNIVVLQFAKEPTEKDYSNIDKFIDDGYKLISTGFADLGWSHAGFQFIFTSQNFAGVSKK